MRGLALAVGPTMQGGQSLESQIRALFAAGEQGGWYDPSDMSTMWQDSAGTTPAALESPVGKINDKSGRGNHLIQATAASRPTLSARYNRLTKTEAISTSAPWAITGVPVITSGVADPLGGTTAFTITTTGVNDQLFQSGAPSALYTTSGWIRRRTGSGAITVFNGTTNIPISPTTSWTYFSVPGGIATTFLWNIIIGTAGDAFDIWHPDARTNADFALSIPAYQRVDTATSYDTSGFPMYLAPDGVDDNMGTGAFTMPATATMAAAILFPASQLGNIFDGITPTNRMILGANTNLYRIYQGVELDSAALRDSSPHVLLANFLGTASSTVEADKITVATGSAGAGTFAGGLRAFADPPGTAQFMSGRFYGGLALARNLTVAEKASVYTYLGSKQGRAL